MRVLILTDADIAAREGAMLSRLEVGLLGHNVRILYAEPADDQLHVDAEGLIAGLTYTAGGSLLTLKPRARRLVRDIDEHIGFDDPSTSRLDVVHVLGSRAWLMGLQTAAASGAHLAIEILNADDLSRIRSFANRANRQLGDHARLIWLAPCQAILSQAKQLSRDTPVLPAYWGTHAQPPPEWPASHEAPLSFAILTAGTNSRNLISLLDALRGFEPARRSGHTEPPLIFLDEHAVSRRHVAFRHAMHSGLDKQLSVVPSLEHSRGLALRCDVLLLPDSRGQQRSIILDAMSSNQPVIASDDPLLADLLVSGQTAQTVTPDDPAAWRASLESLFAETPQERSDRLDRARSLVKTTYTASAHITAIAEAYEQLCGSEPIPFGD